MDNTCYSFLLGYCWSIEFSRYAWHAMANFYPDLPDRPDIYLVTWLVDPFSGSDTTPSWLLPNDSIGRGLLLYLGTTWAQVQPVSVEKSRSIELAQIDLCAASIVNSPGPSRPYAAARKTGIGGPEIASAQNAGQSTRNVNDALEHAQQQLGTFGRLRKICSLQGSLTVATCWSGSSALMDCGCVSASEESPFGFNLDKTIVWQLS